MRDDFYKNENSVLRVVLAVEFIDRQQFVIWPCDHSLITKCLHSRLPCRNGLPEISESICTVELS